MGNFYQDMVAVLDSAKNQIVSPDKIVYDEKKKKLYEEYNKCYNMIFKDSSLKIHIKNVSNYFDIADDSVDSFSDYLDRFNIKNVSRLQEAKKSLKNKVNSIMKKRDNVVKDIRKSLEGPIDESTEEPMDESTKEFVNKSLDELIDKSNDSAKEIHDLCDNNPTGLGKVSKKLLVLAKQQLANKGLYTVKTLSNAVYNEGKGTGMVGALKSAYNILTKKDATEDDINNSYELLCSKHPKGFKNSYDKFVTMANTIVKESKKDKHIGDFERFKELIKECDELVSSSVINYNKAMNDMVEKAKKITVEPRESVDSMSEKIDTKTLYHIFDDVTHNFMVIMNKVGEKGTNGASISKSNQILCIKLLQQYYISSCAVEFLNGTGSGGVVIETETLIWLGLLAVAIILVVAGLVCWGFNRLAHHTYHERLARFFKYLGILFFIPGFLIVWVMASGSSSRRRHHHYRYHWY